MFERIKEYDDARELYEQMVKEGYLCDVCQKQGYGYYVRVNLNYEPDPNIKVRRSLSGDLKDEVKLEWRGPKTVVRYEFPVETDD